MAADAATISIRLVAKIDQMITQLDKAKAKALETATGIVVPFQQANKSVTESLATSASAMSKFGGLTGNQKFIIRDFSYQIADMATQLSMGTAVLRVMGQQVPQMLGPMGVLGAVLGTVVAVAAPLIQVLLGSSAQSKTLAQNMDDLSKMVSEYTSFAQQAVMPTDELAKKYGSATAAARDFISALRDIDQFSALDSMNAVTDKIGKSYGDLTGQNSASMVGTEAMLNYAQNRSVQISQMLLAGQVQDPLQIDKLQIENQDLENSLKLMSDFRTMVENAAVKLQLTRDAAAELLGHMADLQNAKGLEAQTTAAKELAESIRSAYPDLAAMPKPMRDLYESVAKAGNQMALMQGATDGTSGSIQNAANAAAHLADELARAFDAANSLATSSVLPTQLAKLAYDYRGDPVGKARATAAVTFDAQAPQGLDVMPVGVQPMIAKDRQTYIDNAVQSAQYQEQLAVWQKSQTSGARGGASAAKGIDSIFANADNQLAKQQMQIEMIGKTSAEVATLQSRYTLLAEARKRNLDLDQIDLQTGKTLRQEIDDRATAIGEMTLKAQQYTAQADFMQQQQQTLEQGFLDSIVSGKNFASVLGDVAQALAKAALQAALFGDGPFAGGGGGGSLGGLFGAIGSALGFRAGGGPVTAGQPYIVGEHRPELFVPNVSGTIMPSVPKAVGGASGGSSAPVTINVNVQGANGDTHIQELVAQGVSTGLKTYDRMVLPGSVKRIASDPQRIG